MIVYQIRGTNSNADTSFSEQNNQREFHNLKWHLEKSEPGTMEQLKVCSISHGKGMNREKKNLIKPIQTEQGMDKCH